MGWQDAPVVPDWQKAPEVKAAPAYKATATDRVANVGTGANAGIAGLLGLPVDTALNVWDLVKAGVGTVQGAITGKAPSEIFDPADRSKYALSSEYLRNVMNKSAITDTRAIHPEDTANRYLHVAGSALPSALMAQPSTMGQAATAVTQNVLPALAAQKTAEATRGTQFENSAPILASLLTQAAPSAVSSISKKIGQSLIGDSGLTPAQENAASQGEKLGMKLTPGQKTGSEALQQLEAKLESQPYTSGPISQIKKGNQEALNSAWAKAIGETGKSLDSTVLDNAVERLGNNFERFRSKNTNVIIDPTKTDAALTQIDSDLQGLYPGSIRENPLVKQVEELAQKGAINGEQLGKLSSKLGKAAYKQMSTPQGDRDYGQALYEVKDHVDDMLGASLSPADKKAYEATRQQWRAFKQLTSRVNNVNPNTGNVNGATIANALQKSDQNGFLLGRKNSDAYDATKFAQAFKPIVGNSGTATRSMSMSDLALAIPGFIGSRAYFSKPGAKAIDYLSSPTVPLSDTRTLQYLTTQASQLTPEQRRKLTQALGAQ